MSKLTKTEERVLDHAAALAAPFSPTEMGMALGYEQVRASSRVAPALKRLVDLGRLVRDQMGHNRVTYALAAN